MIFYSGEKKSFLISQKTLPVHFYLFLEVNVYRFKGTMPKMHLMC